MSIIDLVLRGEYEAVRETIKKASTELDVADEHERTSLMHAVIDRKADIALLLLEAGANPNAKDADGNTPLHFATQGYDPQIATYLLANGAEIDPLDKNGNSPLSNAVFNSQGNGELIELLISKGANKNLKNVHGVSPLDLAMSIGNYDVAKFLD